jgi:hypothetical protein
MEDEPRGPEGSMGCLHRDASMDMNRWLATAMVPAFFDAPSFAGKVKGGPTYQYFRVGNPTSLSTATTPGTVAN